MPVMCVHPGRDCLDLECPCCCLRCAEDHHEIRYRQRHGWRRRFRRPGVRITELSPGVAEALRQWRAGELGEEYIPSAEDLKWARRELARSTGGNMENQAFRVVGIITIDGERQEREMVIAPPPGKGAGWALTEVARHLNFIADTGTGHHGVWCYFDRRKDGTIRTGRAAPPRDVMVGSGQDAGPAEEVPPGGGLRGSERAAQEADREAEEGGSQDRRRAGVSQEHGEEKAGAAAGPLAGRGQLRPAEGKGTVRITIRLPRSRKRKAAEKRAALIRDARDAASERRLRTRSNGDNSHEWHGRR